MTTFIYLLSSTQIPASVEFGTPAIQAVRFAVSPDNVSFWIGNTNFPAADNAQTDLNANANALLTDAQTRGGAQPFALVNGLTVGNSKVATIVGYPNNPWCPTGVQVVLIGVSGFTSPPTVSLGVVSPNYVDIFPATPLTGFSTLGNIVNLALYTTLATAGNAARSTVDVFARVSVAAVATQYLLLIKPQGGLFV